jgi:hypothetical protein
MSTRRIKKINPIQAGKVAAMIAVVLILIIVVPIMLLVSAVGLGSDNPAFGMVMGGGISIIAIVIFVPVVYGLFAFLFGMLYAFIYNITFRFHGGLEMEYDDMDDEINNIGN